MLRRLSLLMLLSAALLVGLVACDVLGASEPTPTPDLTAIAEAQVSQMMAERRGFPYLHALPPAFLGTISGDREPSARPHEFRGLSLLAEMSTDCPRTFPGVSPAGARSRYYGNQAGKRRAVLV